MRRRWLAVMVVLGCLATSQGVSRAEDLAADVEGKWERTQELDGRTFRHVKEHKGGKTRYKVLDDKGGVIQDRTSDYVVQALGPAKLFVYSNLEVIDGENKGEKADGPFAYIYRVEGDTFYEVQGILTQQTGEV